MKLEHIRRLVNDGNLMLKIGIPSSEDIDGTFSEKSWNISEIQTEIPVVFSGSSSVMLARKSTEF